MSHAMNSPWQTASSAICDIREAERLGDWSSVVWVIHFNTRPAILIYLSFKVPMQLRMVTSLSPCNYAATV